MSVLYSAAAGTFVDQQDAASDTLTGAAKAALVTASGNRIDGSSGQSDAHTGSRTLMVHQNFFNGATFDRARTPIVFKTVVAQAITAGTGITIWDPANAKKFRLMGYVFSASAAVSLKFYAGLTTALTTLLFQGPLLAAAGIDSQNRLGNGILAPLADQNLNLDVSGNATVSGTVWGTEE